MRTAFICLPDRPAQPTAPDTHTHRQADLVACEKKQKDNKIERKAQVGNSSSLAGKKEKKSRTAGDHTSTSRCCSFCKLPIGNPRSTTLKHFVGWQSSLSVCLCTFVCLFWMPSLDGTPLPGLEGYISEKCSEKCTCISLRGKQGSPSIE